jgi:hypothetical protein
MIMSRNRLAFELEGKEQLKRHNQSAITKSDFQH